MSVIDKTRTFFGEVVVEGKKITWPPRDDLRESTMVVIVSVFVLSILLGIVDWSLSQALRILLQSLA